jgi:hypothetical protein
MGRGSLSWTALTLSLIFVVLVISDQFAHADGLTFYVDDDYGNSYPGSGTPTDPFHEIQRGIDAASSGDTVEVAPGHYVELLNISFRNAILIQGAGAGDDPSFHSIIDGDGRGPVVTFIGNTSPATLDGFMVTNGNAANGGGMWITWGDATVSNCTFKANTADKGGGLAIEEALTIKIDHCMFYGNTATTGAGLYRYSFDLNPLTLTDCIVTGNTGDGVYQVGVADVSRCEFSANSDSGLVTEGYETRLTVTDSTFSDNGSGGMVTGNSIYSLNILNSIFSGNGYAGIRNVSQNSGSYRPVNLINCTFVSNSGSGFNTASGWGIDVNLKNCLFWNNTGSLGVAMFSIGGNSATVTNCIMGGGGDLIHWASIDVSYSNIELTSGTFPGTGNINGNPLFVDPYGPDCVLGTADDDFRLRPGSPCIDAGTSDGAPETDMEGNNRFDDPGTPDTGTGPFTYYDMGPFEYRPIACHYDVEQDGDVDGIDLAAFASEFSLRFDETDLGLFAEEFGKADCALPD